MLSNHSKGLLMAAITALLWGTIPLGIKLALCFFTPSTLIFSRFAFSFLALAVYYTFKKQRSGETGNRPLLPCVMAGVALAGNYYGFTRGVDLTSPGNSQIVIQLSPVLLSVFGIFYFRETLSVRQKAGFGFTLLGFALFYLDQLLNLLGSLGDHLKGDSWILFAALTWTAFAVTQKQMVRHWEPQRMNLIVFGTATLLFSPFSDFSEFRNIGWLEWGVILFLGANTLVSYGMLAESFKLIPASKVGMIVILNPILTLALSAVLSNQGVTWMDRERIGLLGYAGAGLLLYGVRHVVRKS